MTKVKNVVVIGGGNGAAVSLLALRRSGAQFAVSAVIGMSDSGGSSGRLRKEFSTLPPGDILRALLAMSKYDYYTLRQIFYEKRFTDAGALSQHNLGNLFLTLASQYSDKKYPDALAALSQALECVGPVLPVTLETTQLHAELNDGTEQTTEVAIDRPSQEERGKTIASVWLKPEGVRAYKPALEALASADYIILGPGSLYTSIIPSLLIADVKQVLQESKAKLVYVVGNGYEAEGELGPTTMTGFVEALQRYVPRPIDMVVYNTADLGAKERRFYEEKKWGVAVRDADKLAGRYTVIGHPFERDGGGLSKERLGELFKKVLV
jgi:uncharacterized cofD-like protein